MTIPIYQRTLGRRFIGTNDRKVIVLNLRCHYTTFVEKTLVAVARYYIENYGENKKPITTALDFTEKLMVDKGHQSVYLVINDDTFKTNLEKIGIPESEDEQFVEYGSFTYEIISWEDLKKKHNLYGAILISVWLREQKLFELEDSLSGITAIIGIPLHDETLSLWRQTTYRSIDFAVSVCGISDMSLKHAMDNLPKSINWDLLHADDEETIKATISRFKTTADPIELFAYLRREKHLNYKRCMEFKEWVEEGCH